MLNAPVATIDGIEFHPQASNVGIVHVRDKFMDAASNRLELSAVIYRRPHIRQPYLALFNNVSGVRDLIETLDFAKGFLAKTNDFNNEIHYRKNSRTNVSSASINDPERFFALIPSIKDDIDFAIRQLSACGYSDVMVSILNEFTDSTRKQNETHQFHIDKKPTYYIQIGGAGMEFTNAIPQRRMFPSIPVDFGEEEISTIRVAFSCDEENVKPHEIGILKPADLMYFRGYETSDMALVHRAPHESAVKREGRLAISIYPV